jgi:hypothetical protein
MTTPSEPQNGPSEPQVDLTKNDPTADAPFDPYRFGKPDHPVPPEYAPPGYTPPPSVTPPDPGPYATSYPPPPQQGQPYDPAHPPYPYGAPPYGNAPYGNAPYGAPPPPYYHSYTPPKTGNGKATAALVLGILAIVMFWTSIFDAVLVILALIFGFIALREVNSRRSGGKGMAVAGLICAAVGAILAIVWTVYILSAVNKCGGIDQNNTTGFQQCVQDHL